MQDVGHFFPDRIEHVPMAGHHTFGCHKHARHPSIGNARQTSPQQRGRARRQHLGRRNGKITSWVTRVVSFIHGFVRSEQVLFSRSREMAISAFRSSAISFKRSVPNAVARSTLALRANSSDLLSSASSSPIFVSRVLTCAIFRMTRTRSAAAPSPLTESGEASYSCRIPLRRASSLFW